MLSPGCSAEVAHRFWEARVAGSIPATPIGGLTRFSITYYNLFVRLRQMSRSKFHSKFKSDLKKLTAAIEGSVVLDEDYPKLYQKLIRFYEDQGIQLYDDPEDDYNVILDQVEADLIESGVYA